MMQKRLGSQVILCTYRSNAQYRSQYCPNASIWFTVNQNPNAHFAK